MIDQDFIFRMFIRFPGFPIQSEQQELPIAIPVHTAVLRGKETDKGAVPYQPGRGKTLGMEGDLHTVCYRDAICRLRAPAVNLYIRDIALRAVPDITDLLRDPRDMN